jgi:hypothetical protein
MMEGEEDREKLFLEKLGLSEDVKNALSDKEKPLDEVVNLYTSNFTNLTKQTYINNWDEDRVGQIKKEAQIGTYNAVEKKVSEILGLKSENYKDVDKGRLEKMLQDAATHYNSTIEDLKKVGKSGGADEVTVQQLKDQLTQANQRLEELKELEEGLPTKLDAVRKEVQDKYFISQSTHSAIDKIENILPGIDKDIIMMVLDKIAILEVEEDKSGKPTIAIKDPTTKAPYKSSPTANYTNLSLFVQKEILEKKNWIAKQNTTNTPPANNGGGEGSGGKKQWKIHKNAQNATK